MKMIRRAFVLLCVCCVFLPSLADAAEEFFPIMAWGTLAYARERSTDVKLYEEMKECGFTIAGFANSDEQIEAARQGGMRVLVQNGALCNCDWTNPEPEAWRKAVIPVVEKYKDDDTVYGYYIKDEPNQPEVAGVLQMGTLMKELAPGKLAYLNLFPNSSNPTRFVPLGYYKYVDAIYASDFPNCGFDQYVFYHDGFMRPTFYKGMEIHRECSQRYGKSWWYCALSIAHRYYAEPTFTQLAHQAFSALAYGARGLSWFTYLPVQQNGWYASPLNDVLDRTHTWYDLKVINRSIQNYAYVLNHLKSDRVYHFGSTVPETDEQVLEADGDSLIESMENSNNWLVGEFTHEETGDRWLIIVNKNLEAPVECRPVWREGRAPSRVMIHDPQTRGEREFSRGQDTNIFQPGMGALIHLYYEK